MSKDKKKKKKSVAKTGGATAKLKALSANPLVADVVAATLVAAAAALKDSNKARQLAVNASKDLEGLAKKNAARGNALWQLALDVGRKSIEALGSETPPKKTKSKPKAKAKAKAATGAKSTAKAKTAPKRAKSGTASAKSRAK